MMALQHVAQHKNIAFQSFYNLIDTVYKDQQFTMFETDAELFGYCYGVAGTVGEVLTPILSDHETHQTYDVARRLGESLQLINILRDVGEDFENERIYFSKQRLKQYEVDIAEVYQMVLIIIILTYGNIMQLSQKKIFEMLWIKSKYLVLKHNQS